MEPHYSVASVTVLRNPGALLRRHLEALLQQSRPLDEVIMVDNASTDGTRELLQREYPQVTFLPLPENTGVGGGFSAGLSDAVAKKHDWVWIFDQDSTPATDALEELLAALRLDNEFRRTAGVLASLSVDSETGIPSFGSLWKDRFVRVPSHSRLASKCLVDSVISSGSLVRREVVEKVGLPRADFFMDFVDHEYNLRIRRQGYTIAVIPRSVLHHTLGKPRLVKILGSTRLWSQQPAWRHYYMSRNDTFTIWHEFSNLRAKCFLLVRLLRRAIGILLLDSQKRAKLKMMWIGFWDGVRGRLGIRLTPS